MEEEEKYLSSMRAASKLRQGQKGYAADRDRDHSLAADVEAGRGLTRRRSSAGGYD